MTSCIVLETAESSTASHSLSVNAHLMSNISIVCMNALISLVHMSSDAFKFILASPAVASSISLQPKCLCSQCTEDFAFYSKTELRGLVLCSLSGALLNLVLVKPSF